MAIYSGMFNSVNGDRKYNAWWFALYFSRFIGDGVFPNPSTGLQVLANENMTTVVRPGDGWIKGYFIHNDSDFVLQHNLADGVLKRIDRIVMRLDFQAREIRIEIKKGAFASKPVAPALQRDGDAYELALADVLINNGTTQISQAHITDTRLNKELCGIVKGTVAEVDTTTIFNQYQDWLQTQIDFYEGDFLAWTDDKKVEFEAWRALRETDFDTWQAQEKSDFDAWFLTIQNILDGDVAGNLLNMINSVSSELNEHMVKKATETTLGHIKGKTNTSGNILAESVPIIDVSDNFTSTNVEGALSELFTDVSNGKKVIGTAITDVDEIVVVPNEPTFQQLADAIGQISTGLISEVVPGESVVFHDTSLKYPPIEGEWYKPFEYKILIDGYFRIQYDMRHRDPSSNQFKGQIHKNDEVYGILRTAPNGHNAEFRTFKEDLHFRQGDLLQIYCYKGIYGQQGTAVAGNVKVSIKTPVFVEGGNV